MKYNLKIDNINGFSYKVPNSLICSPVIEETGVILPLKNSLRFYNGVRSKEIYQTDKEISAIAISGPFLAIGVKGFLGELITTYFLNIYEDWNVKKLCYQKTKISKLAISNNGKYLCSVGNSDDKTQQFVIINTQQDFTIATKIFYRKTVKGKEKIVDIQFSSTNSLFFALMYLDKLYFVKIKEETEQVQQILIKSNRVRQFNKIIFDEHDIFCYTASKNGDIAEMDVTKFKEVRVGPKKRIIIAGIKLIKKIDAENILIVGEKGFLAVVQIKQLKIIKEVTLNEQIISVSDFVDGIAFISTVKAVIYKFLSDTLEAKPFYVCIKQKINQIVFADISLDSVAVCSSNQITIWSVKDLKPQLKIAIPKILCNSICIDKYGKYIVSGWSDGSLRLFYTYNGKLMTKFQNCHPGPISKVIIDYNQTKIISGGQKGQIKGWHLNQKKFGLAMGSMSHHVKKINQLKINPERFQQMVCCCQDGSYSIWNLQSFDLMYCFKVCNFIKDCFFTDSFTLELVGSGSYLYKVIKANGKLVQKKEINNSHTNCLFNFENMIQQQMLIYGGETQYVYLINNTIKGEPMTEQKVYGEVSALKLLPDKETIIVGTNDGIILKLELKQHLIEKEESQKEEMLPFL